MRQLQPPPDSLWTQPGTCSSLKYHQEGATLQNWCQHKGNIPTFCAGTILWYVNWEFIAIPYPTLSCFGDTILVEFELSAQLKRTTYILEVKSKSHRIKYMCTWELSLSTGFVLFSLLFKPIVGLIKPLKMVLFPVQTVIVALLYAGTANSEAHVVHMWTPMGSRQC